MSFFRHSVCSKERSRAHLPAAFLTVRSRGSGLTLIESVVSITILAVAVVGPMTLTAHSLKAASASRAEIIATHLAEEGLEVVHNLRDNASADDSTANKTGWKGSFFANCDTAAGCVVDPTQQAGLVLGPAALQECSVSCGSRAIVYFNPATGLYRQSAAVLGSPWVATQFSRTVFLTVDATAARQLTVRSTVTYPGYGGKTQTISVSSDLYNWFPYLR